MLFLVGMGLNEQILNKNFNFINCAEEADVFTLMKRLVGKPESEPHADLLEYLLEVIIIFAYFVLNLSKMCLK